VSAVCFQSFHGHAAAPGIFRAVVLSFVVVSLLCIGDDEILDVAVSCVADFSAALPQLVRLTHLVGRNVLLELTSSTAGWTGRSTARTGVWRCSLFFDL
jgi:hypothetical protein